MVKKLSCWFFWNSL